MTYRHIFLNYTKEDFRRRIWTFLLSIYLYFSCILDYVMSLQDSRLFWGSTELGPSNPSWFSITVITAVLCAYQGFSYLFSETQCDFYYALPFSRRSLFLGSYLNSLLIGILPCIIGRFTCMIIEGSFSSSARYYTCMGILISIVGFLFLYHTALVILFFSGRLLVAAAVTILAAVYGPLMFGFVIKKYSSIFFQTYYREDLMNTLAIYTSPYTLYQTFSGVLESSGIDDWSFKEHLIPLLAAILFLILLFILAVILFQKRPAESCGKALTFRAAEFPIKLLLVLPVSLLCGCCFMNISLKERSLFWLAAGVLFGAFTAHGILESFFRFDIRGMISQKIHLLIICGFSLLLTVSFYFDWWNYDAYFPSSEQIVSIALSPSGLDDASWQNEASEPVPYPISDVTDARLGTIKLTGENKETALDWLKTLRQENLKAANAGLTPLSYIVTAYTCNDKTTLYRKYPIYREETYTSFSTIYDMMEFKAGLIPLCSYDTTGRQHFIWSNGLETYHLNLTQEENEALLAAYKTDAEQLHMNTLQQEFPIGTLSLSYGNYGGTDSGYLYSGFTNTIRLLEEKGIPTGNTLSESYEICELLVYQITSDTTVPSSEAQKKVLIDEITDAGEIQSLQPWLIYSGYAVNPVLNPVDTDYKITVLFRNSEGETYDYAEAFLKRGNPFEQ